MIANKIKHIVKTKVNTIKSKILWKKQNMHNLTRIDRNISSEVLNLIKQKKIIIGKDTYGKINISSSGAYNEGLEIGAYCSISNKSYFLLGGEHDYKCISTYPFEWKFDKKVAHGISKGKIVLDDDVWVADNAMILSGVHIGQGAIIGAGSVVTKDVPPYAIVGGVPARIIKYRFSDTIIEKLMKLDFSKLDFNHVDKQLLNKDIDENNIDRILNELIHV